MSKVFRIATWALGVLVVLTIALYAYLRSADLTVYEGQIERYASRVIGHKLDIDGRFELQFGGHSRLVAENVSLTNPDWPDDVSLLRVGHLTVVVDTWTLLSGPLIIEELEVRDIEGRVEVLSDRRSNWDTGREPDADDDEFDSDRLAFRRVRMDGIEFSYLDPRRPRPIDIAIESLTVLPDSAHILDLDVQGTINDLPLWADGKLGPWENFVDGKDISADLDVTLGTVRLSIDGSAEDLPFLDGIVAHAVLTGPDIGRVIERLGLPPFAEGAFEINADINRIDGGHRLSAEGNLGAIDIVANGSIDRFIATREAQLDFSVLGPNIQYFAELLGIDGAPEAPFRVAGDLSLDGQIVTFSDTRVSVGSNIVTGSGEVDFNPDFPDLALSISAEGPDFSVLGPFLAVQGLPSSPFAVKGDVRKQGASWRANAVEAIVGDNRITADGSLTAGGREDSALSFRAVGPDISILHDFTNLQGLPARPFDVTASIQSHPQGIAVENAVGVFGDNRIEVSGVVVDHATLEGTTLRFQAVGPELSNIALLTGIPHLPAGPYDISGALRIDDDWLVFREAAATVGDLAATASGQLGMADEEGEFAVQFSLNGPDAAQFEALPWLEPFYGNAFEIVGGVERADDDLELTDARVSIGEFHFFANGTLSLSPMSNDSDLVFSLAGPSLRTIGQMFDSDLLADNNFDISGEVVGTPSGFAMRNFVAGVGDSDIEGEFAADLREKPRVTARLTSSFLDLRDRLSPMVDPEEKPDQAAEEESGLLFSDEPIDGRLLQAADIDIELRAARLRTNTLDVSDFVIGMQLLDGDLRIEPLSMLEGAGTLTGRLQFSPGENGYLLDAVLEADSLHLGLVAGEEQTLSSLPAVSGKVELRGSGASVHQIMAAANGSIAVRQGKGQVKEFLAAVLFRDVVLEALRTINPLRKKEDTRTLDCGIYDISITEGVAKLDQVAIQTDQLLLVATGRIDLNTEKLDMNFRAKPREGIGVSLGTIANSFLGVGGTLASPRLTLDPKGSVTTTGVAVATGGLSLLARGVWDRLSAAKDICKESTDAKPKNANE